MFERSLAGDSDWVMLVHQQEEPPPEKLVCPRFMNLNRYTHPYIKYAYKLNTHYGRRNSDPSVVARVLIPTVCEYGTLIWQRRIWVAGGIEVVNQLTLT